MSGARIDITAVDKASPVVKSVQGTFQNLAGEAKKSILTGVGLGAGVTAFQLAGQAAHAAAGFVVEAAQAAIADEESVNRLSASLKANVSGFDGNTDAVESWITAQQKLGFSDEQLRDSLTVLTGATHDVGKAQQIASTAMDLARFKGIDLRTASEALIKVEGGHYRSLAQLGIRLREGATSTEALAAVQAVASGQAKAFGETTAGAMEAASIAFDEVKESLGKQLMPLLMTLAEWARDDGVPALAAVVDQLDEFGNAIANLPTLGLPLGAIKDDLLAQAEAARMAAGGTGQAYAEMAGLGVVYAPKFKAANKTFYEPLYGEAHAAKLKAIAETKALPGELAKALIDGQDNVKTGMEALLETEKTTLATGKEIAYLETIASGNAIRGALNDSRPAVRAAAQQVQADAIEQLKLLKSGAADAAVDAGTTFAEQLRLQKVAAGQAAADVKRSATGNLEFTDDAETKGSDGGGGFVKGVKEGTAPAGPTATLARNAVLSALKYDSWPGGYSIGSTWVNAMIAAMKAKQSAFLGEAQWYKNIYGGSLPTAGPLQHPESGGKSIAEAWLGGMVKSLNSGQSSVTGAFPSLDGGGGGAMNGGGYGMGGGTTIQLTVDGKVLAEIVDRNLYYMRPAASRYPTG